MINQIIDSIEDAIRKDVSIILTPTECEHILSALELPSPLRGVDDSFKKKK